MPENASSTNVNIKTQDKLITISLICLRDCLESSYIEKRFDLGTIHRLCPGRQYQLDYTNNVYMHLDMYSEALSTLFFKKGSMRSKDWWLSTFYSLIIRSMVRIGLLEIAKGRAKGEILATRQVKAIKQYMHLGVRLFIAGSGIHDPLMRDYSALLTSSGTDYQAAQEATRQDSWGVHGIKSSADFLRTIFEDEGGPLEEPPKNTTDPTPGASPMTFNHLLYPSSLENGPLVLQDHSSVAV
jgi:hypothetical protein